MFAGKAKDKQLAYYENPWITAVKSFILQAPGASGDFDPWLQGYEKIVLPLQCSTSLFS